MQLPKVFEVKLRLFLLLFRLCTLVLSRSSMDTCRDWKRIQIGRVPCRSEKYTWSFVPCFVCDEFPKFWKHTIDRQLIVWDYRSLSIKLWVLLWIIDSTCRYRRVLTRCRCHYCRSRRDHRFLQELQMELRWSLQ